MNDFAEVTCQKLLEKCPREIRLGNWDDQWQEVRQRLITYEAALVRLTVEHISYDDPTVGDGSYGTGVVDGHRCAAKIARKALGVPDNE